MRVSRPDSTYRHPKHMNHCLHQQTRLLIGLWVVLLLIPARSRAVDETFALLETKTGVYSNVTVTTKSAAYIVIQHAGGLGSLKISDLPPEVHEALGYGAVKGAKNSSMLVTAKARALVDAIPTQKIEAAWSKHAPTGMPALKLTSTFLLAVLGIGAGLYLLFCYCGTLICRKIGKPAGWMMWVPIVQYIPLLRAANLSPLWLLGIFVPILNIWVHIMWSFRIAGARGKGFLTALGLILPTYPLAFLYLAFAGGAPAADEKCPPKKIELQGMTFDQA